MVTTRQVLCLSMTPFFDGAREPVTHGCDPNAMLILRLAGFDTDCLRAKLGTAASLTVEEIGYGPQLRRWKPFPTLAVKPRNAPVQVQYSDYCATHFPVLPIPDITGVEMPCPLRAGEWHQSLGLDLFLRIRARLCCTRRHHYQ